MKLSLHTGTGFVASCCISQSSSSGRAPRWVPDDTILVGGKSNWLALTLHVVQLQRVHFYHVNLLHACMYKNA